MPFITWHLPVFNRIQCVDWVWKVSEGPAKNSHCTSWCNKLRSGYSNDGTHEYLKSIQNHSNVCVESRRMWDGKIEMVNAQLGDVEDGDVVFQIDADELWTARQIETVCYMLDKHVNNNAAQFFCRYFVGQHLLITSDDGYGNHGDYEWRRAWKAQKGFLFTRHEPPETNRTDVWINRDTTRSLGLVFDHYAYAFEDSVAFKEKYYGYNNAVEQWRSLQECSAFPVKAKDYLKWIKDDVEVNRI